MSAIGVHLGQALAVGVLALTLLLALPVAVLALQILADVLGPRAPASPAARRDGSSGNAAILVPAHNEESGIARTLALLLPQLAPGDRLLVVADNCDDATADCARAAGAEVIERFHEARGKGFALAFGMEHLRQDPPAAVVIVDADCELAPGALDALLADLRRTGRPVQSLYLMLAPADAGVGRRLAQFAWRVRNAVRPSGWHRLGLPCQLMGTGMAFAWDMLRDAPLANASIVEDMKLGIDLARAGRPPVFCRAALVTSQFPDTSAASATQRTRWEHGHLETILREVPRMAAAAVARRDGKLLGMALDLAVPPLALFAGLLVLDWTLSVVAWAAGAAGALVILASVLPAIFLAVMLVGWHARGRDLVSFGELLAVPWYILAKIPLYVRFVFRRQRAWIRTDRR